MDKLPKYYSFALILFCSMAINAVCFAQKSRMSEADIKLETKYLEGYAAQMSGDSEKAEGIYKAILDVDSKNDATMYQLARLYCLSKRNDKALDLIKTAIALNAQNPWYKVLLADIYQKYGKNREAADIYGQLVKLTPDNYDNYMQWAYLLGLAGDAKEAIKAFDALEKRTGVQESIARQKHSLYLVLDDSKKAAKELQKLIDSDPSDVSHYQLLAEYYQRIGDTEKAKEVFQKILVIAPNDVQATLALAQSKKVDNQDVAYINSLVPIFQNKTLALDKKIMELIPYVNKVAEKRDKTLADALLGVIRTLDEAHPNEAKIYAIQADVLYQTGQLSEAAALYKKTLSLNKKVYAVWEQLMYIQLETKDFDGLLKTSDEAMDLFPNQGNAFYMNGLALNTKAKYDDALNNLQQALLMAGKNQRLRIDTQHEIAKSYYLQKKYTEANTWNQKALIGGENASYILEKQGDIYYKLNDIDNALVFWKKAKDKGAMSTGIEKKINDRKTND